MISNRILNKSEIRKDMFFNKVKIDDYVAFTSGEKSNIYIGQIQSLSKSGKTVRIICDGTLIGRRVCEVIKINDKVENFKNEHAEKMI